MKLYMQAILEEEGKRVWTSLQMPIVSFREGADFDETMARVSALMAAMTHAERLNQFKILREDLERLEDKIDEAAHLLNVCIGRFYELEGDATAAYDELRAARDSAKESGTGINELRAAEGEKT